MGRLEPAMREKEEKTREEQRRGDIQRSALTVSGNENGLTGTIPPLLAVSSVNGLETAVHQRQQTQLKLKPVAVYKRPIKHLESMLDRRLTGNDRRHSIYPHHR